MKQNRPKGIMNVVRQDDSGVSGICQNPKMASNCVKIFAPANSANVCSTDGRWWCSCRTPYTLIQLCKVHTNHDLSCGFGTTTIPENQSVGSMTGTITPSCLILSNSALTLGKRGTGTRCSAVNTKGFAPSFI